METSTTIRVMLAGNRISVPAYQRGYSWETACKKNRAPKQVNAFLSDLEDSSFRSAKSPYHFGHFLFEEKPDKTFRVIDGQQRLTTIIIFLSALFRRLRSIRKLTESELEIFEDIIKRKAKYRVETVCYDQKLFKDYVVDQTQKEGNGLETKSAKRIVTAFDFFTSQLENKDESYLLKMLDTVQNATCTTHLVKNEPEATKLFLLHNNRGTKASKLEIINAQFMFHIHLHEGEEKALLFEELKTRFETIYRSISSIENNINEDEVLAHTLSAYFNSNWRTNSIEQINKLLSNSSPLAFIKAFTDSLLISIEHYPERFRKDKKETL